MNEQTEPDFCARCMETDEYCRCYAVTLTPWHVWIATATDGVGREPIATKPTRAAAYDWAAGEWAPDLPNGAAYLIARTYQTAVKYARDLYGN